MWTLRLLAIAACVVAGALRTCADLSVLPVGASGLWHGTPSYSVVGPWDQKLGFAVQELTDGSGFLISDVFGDTELVPGSFQRFWVRSNGSSSTLEYCGALGKGYVTADMTPMTRIQFVTASTGNNATQASYTGAWYNAFDITFTITMLPSKQLQFLVTFADAVHLQVVLDRVGDSKPIAAPAVGPDGVIACKLATPQLPGEQTVPATAAPRRRSSGCPYAAAVAAAGLGNNNSNNNNNASGGDATSAAVMPQPGDDVCYVVSPAMNYSIAWKVPSSDDTDIAITVRAKLAAAGNFLALGYGPRFPYMFGMDVVMAYASASAPGGFCVRAMYVEGKFSTPVDNAKLNLSDTSVSYSDGVLSFTYTRPLAAGFQPMAPHAATLQYHLAFAQGNVQLAQGSQAGSCTDVPQYHGILRGMHGTNFFEPGATFADFQKC